MVLHYLSLSTGQPGNNVCPGGFPQIGGFWAALRVVYSETEEQRCWKHEEVANGLDKLPKRLQPRAKALLYEVMYPPDCESALEEIACFSEDIRDATSKWSRHRPKTRISFQRSSTSLPNIRFICVRPILSSRPLPP